MRYVQRARQDRDPDTGAFRGLAPGAFMLGPKDRGGMSVTWVEKFGPLGLGAKRQAAAAFRESQNSKKLGATAVFATAQVEQIIHAGQMLRKALRIVYDPVPGNPGHAEVRHFDDSDLEVLDYLATDVFTDIDHVADLDLGE